MSAKANTFADLMASLGSDLTKEALDEPCPCPERCLDILQSIERESNSKTKGSCKMTIAILERSKIGKTATKSIKSFKRHRRTSEGDAASKWDDSIATAERLLSIWKEVVEEESKRAKKRKEESDALPGLPNSAQTYRNRLVKQKKDMYKDPPVRPPPSIVVDPTNYGPPKRNKKTGELTFPHGNDEEVNQLLKEFHPNRTPEEVLRAGSFGGTYFRPIVSAVTNVRYSAADVLRDTVDPAWIEGLHKSTAITSSTYRESVNKFGVKCGGSLGMWESSGWISDSDPYGWFQWYCRFYRGRRCSDDARQISRWAKSAGPRGRFRSQLCNKCIAANTTANDTSISPVIRQTLLHWGLELTPDLLERHRKKKK